VKWVKTTVVVLTVLGGAALTTVWAARQGLLTADDAELRARYALPQSRFVTLDGQQIHYVDEGRGPVVLLLHGSYGSLRMWEDWARILRTDYRVIRFDRPPMGLSSPAEGGPKSPGVADMQLIDALTATLNVEQFVLVGTSSAGLPAAAYAASRPDRVTGVVLANIAIDAIKPAASHLPLELRFGLQISRWLGGWRPEFVWRIVLQRNLYDSTRVTPRLVEEWADLNNRAVRLPKPGYSPSGAMFARTREDLPKLRVPTLLLWSANDHEFPVDTTAQQGLAAVGSADKALVVIDRCGHMMPIDCGERSALAAKATFDRWTRAMPVQPATSVQ
jgi:pimeloyl-ACP methyl ester carboxylesterase